MHIIGAGVTTGVDPEAADEIRVLQLDDLHRQTYHAAINRSDLAVAVGVDGDVGGVTVLVLTIAGGASHTTVVRGRAESGMDVAFMVMYPDPRTNQYKRRVVPIQVP